MISKTGETHVPPPLMKEGLSAEHPMRGPQWDVERYVFSWLRHGDSIEETVRWCEKMINEGNFSRITMRCPYHGINIFWKRVCPLCNERYRMCIDYLVSLKKTVRQYCATRPELVGLESWEIRAKILDWTRTGRWEEREAPNASRPAEEKKQVRVPVFDANRRRAAAILGVAPDVAPDVLKARFREMIKQYHPDSVHHLGHEFRVMAEEKTKEIIWANGLLSEQLAGGRKTSSGARA